MADSLKPMQTGSRSPEPGARSNMQRQPGAAGRVQLLYRQERQRGNNGRAELIKEVVGILDPSITVENQVTDMSGAAADQGDTAEAKHARDMDAYRRAVDPDNEGHRGLSGAGR